MGGRVNTSKKLILYNAVIMPHVFASLLCQKPGKNYV